METNNKIIPLLRVGFIRLRRPEPEKLLMWTLGLPGVQEADSPVGEYKSIRRFCKFLVFLRTIERHNPKTYF